MTSPAQSLDRRRDKASSAGAAADKAQAAVTDIDHQLDTIAGLTQQQKQALRHARDEAERLKRSLAAAAKRQSQLTRQRKKAVAQADKARGKAKAAEAKYDKEVLAELIRREKAASAGPAPVPADSAPDGSAREVAAKVTAAKASGARPPRRPAADPAPEKPSAATTTARRTAARATR
ncbi:hypothetical protein [Actinoplanes friuliensis]|uniref:Uncharacterized protein n=1 Tax=Actinoplanes friuliensis DSM 7358 TaxID=1246995 RepID=U5VPL0_9ACTN|nr:hypothetical protein [Actinoplanes friuliensis]AGZ38903.1 hypothetical protein AFR_03070 [Actinoplanes friuliensis DSM 7358]